ncbi:hypothetical protein BJ878DRAFT_480340 [Calycina marina]|uniref:Uncharacterized protein n=1 Tax=Calycina marina TaxID=1763456 RepID=A0A9P7Z3L5_9HELO|nr:hypothetical protein BJ878DRAFT_480340 [Calycina marina]
MACVLVRFAYQLPSLEEIEIFEGIRKNFQGLQALHTSPGCQVTGNQGAARMYGIVTSYNCDDLAQSSNYGSQHQNQGCAAANNAPASYGTAFSALGELIAKEWTSDAIKMWNFQPGSTQAHIALVHQRPLRPAVMPVSSCIHLHPQANRAHIRPPQLPRPTHHLQARSAQWTLATRYTHSSTDSIPTGPGTTGPGSQYPTSSPTGSDITASVSAGYETSTVFTTEVYTVTSCVATVTNGSAGPHDTTVTFPLCIAVCTVTKTQTPGQTVGPGHTTSIVLTTLIHTITEYPSGVKNCTVGSVTTETKTLYMKTSQRQLEYTAPHLTVATVRARNHRLPTVPIGTAAPTECLFESTSTEMPTEAHGAGPLKASGIMAIVAAASLC